MQKWLYWGKIKKCPLELPFPPRNSSIHCFQYSIVSKKHHKFPLVKPLVSCLMTSRLLPWPLWPLWWPWTGTDSTFQYFLRTSLSQWPCLDLTCGGLLILCGDSADMMADTLSLLDGLTVTGRSLHMESVWATR